MTQINIFLVDDQWASNRGLLQAAFAGVQSVVVATEQAGVDGTRAASRLVLHSFRGQTHQAAALCNDAEATVRQLQTVVRDCELSLVLLDMRFDSGPLDSRGRPTGLPGDESFGKVIYRAIEEAFPKLPIVFLSTYGQAEIGDETLPYLSKEDITDHSLAVCLLRHGKLTNEQRRGLMHMDTEVVASEISWRAYNAAFEVAPLQLPVMITGETGTGKEVLARYIHRCSANANGPFVAVNVNAVPKDLFEAMFFGHTRGSFTGASEDRPGYFEQADGGTLFLDEVGDLPLDLQVKLLRVLESKAVKRLGARQEIQVDVRLVSATNRVDANGFIQGLREDFKFRLCGLSIHLSPLRERGEDVLPLAEMMLEMAMREYGKSGIGFGPSCIAYLESAPLPGNARELRQSIFSAVARTGNRALVTAAMLDLRNGISAVQQPAVNGDVTHDQFRGNDHLVKALVDRDAPSSLDMWLEAGRQLPTPIDYEALIGSKSRLDDLYANLNRRLAAAALRATRNAVTGEYYATAAAQLLFDDSSLRGNVPSRRLATMLNFTQDRKFSNDELDTIVNSILASGAGPFEL